MCIFIYVALVLSREYEVRDLIHHIGLIPKVIPLKLFLDTLPSSPVDFNARCVDVLACILEAIRNAMAGNVVRRWLVFILSTNLRWPAAIFWERRCSFLNRVFGM